MCQPFRLKSWPMHAAPQANPVQCAQPPQANPGQCDQSLRLNLVNASAPQASFFAKRPIELSSRASPARSDAVTAKSILAVRCTAAGRVALTVRGTLVSRGTGAKAESLRQPESTQFDFAFEPMFCRRSACTAAWDLFCAIPFFNAAVTCCEIRIVMDFQKVLSSFAQ